MRFNVKESLHARARQVRRPATDTAWRHYS